MHCGLQRKRGKRGRGWLSFSLLHWKRRRLQSPSQTFQFGHPPFHVSLYSAELLSISLVTNFLSNVRRAKRDALYLFHSIFFRFPSLFSLYRSNDNNKENQEVRTICASVKPRKDASVNFVVTRLTFPIWDNISNSIYKRVCPKRNGIEKKEKEKERERERTKLYRYLYTFYCTGYYIPGRLKLDLFKFFSAFPD